MEIIFLSIKNTTAGPGSINLIKALKNSINVLLRINGQKDNLH